MPSVAHGSLHFQPGRALQLIWHYRQEHVAASGCMWSRGGVQCCAFLHFRTLGSCRQDLHPALPRPPSPSTLPLRCARPRARRRAPVAVVLRRMGPSARCGAGRKVTDLTCPTHTLACDSGPQSDRPGPRLPVISSLLLFLGQLQMRMCARRDHPVLVKGVAGRRTGGRAGRGGEGSLDWRRACCLLNHAARTQPNKLMPGCCRPTPAATERQPPPPPPPPQKQHVPWLPRPCMAWATCPVLRLARGLTGGGGSGGSTQHHTCSHVNNTVPWHL